MVQSCNEGGHGCTSIEVYTGVRRGRGRTKKKKGAQDDYTRHDTTLTTLAY